MASLDGMRKQGMQERSKTNNIRKNQELRANENTAQMTLILENPFPHIVSH